MCALKLHLSAMSPLIMVALKELGPLEGVVGRLVVPRVGFSLEVSLINARHCPFD